MKKVATMAMMGHVEAGSRKSGFLFPGALKTCANLREGKNLVIPIQ
jgi:hypothetical protein